MNLLIPRFSPESRECDNMIRQVFWLMLHRLTFPSATADSGVVVRVIPLPGRPERGIYSYGDSAGFTPDFPFNDA
jgi:hypothetical protein